MSFHKRFITKKIVENTKEGNLLRLLNADALVMDMWSGRFFELYKNGSNKEQCVKILEKEFDKYGIKL